MFEEILYNFKGLFKKRFKIGIITPQYPEEGKGTNKGVAIHVENISRELAKLGCEVHVFTIGKKRSNRNDYFNEGKREIHRIKVEFQNPIKDPVMERILTKSLFDAQILNEIIAENSKSPFDILHSHTTISSGLIAKNLIDCKCIHTLHVLNKNRIKLMTKEEKKYYNLTKWIENVIIYADALISVSDKIKEEIQEGYFYPKDKIFTIYNAVDLGTFNQESVLIKDKKILYVGRFSQEKGIDILPKIIKGVFKENKEVKFEIVASDKSIPESLKKAAKEIEYLIKENPDRIIWHKEELNKEELVHLYNGCVIYLQPSRYDSFPTTVLEAMACGKPVIVSARGGMPEMVGNAGSVVPFEEDEFIEEISNLLKNYRLRERYGRRAKERVKIFNWEDAAKKTLTLYKKVAGKLKKGEDKYGIC
jgi:glycosyltransferase involved in cell wall biosynthesis